MGRLTGKQVQTIENALYHLDRATRYIFAPQNAVCVRGTRADTTLHYTRADGQTMYEVQREYGSDLCGIRDARRALQAMLDLNTALRPIPPSVTSARSTALDGAAAGVMGAIGGA